MKIVVLIFSVIICVSSVFAQQKVLLFDFEARGVDSTVIRITNQLLRDALNNTLKYIVVDPPPGIQHYGVVPACQEASNMGIPLAIIGSVMQLGTSRIINYQLLDATTTSVIFGDKAETPTIEEYPLLFDRIAQAVVEEKPFSLTLVAEKVTTPEIAPQFKNPRKPYASLFLSAGYLYPFKDRIYPSMGGEHLSNGLFNLRVAVSFETPGMLVLAQMGLMRGKMSEQDVTFDIGIHKFLSAGDWAPTIGGSIGVTNFSWQYNSETWHDDGLSLSAGIGLLGLRSYYFRVFTMAQANVIYSNTLEDFIPGFKIEFGLTSPTMGPDATIEMDPGCVGITIGAFFLTGLVIALTQ